MRRSQRNQGGATPKNFDKWIAQTRRIADKVIRKKSKTDVPRRKSKRNSARATPSTKNFEEMLKQAESLARESIYTEACARKIKHEGPPFRLLDLPPELRERVFEYMVFRPSPLKLQDLVAPLITAMSKQVRAECMASFFALNTFQMTVETNICLVKHINRFRRRFGSLRAAMFHRPLTINNMYWINLIYSLEDSAGGILMQENTQNWLRNINREVAVFRNIQVVLEDTLNHPALCETNPRAPDELQMAWMIKSRDPRGRDIFTVTLWHSMQLVPHFVSWPSNDMTARNYYDWPAAEFFRLLNEDHPNLRTFNLDALITLAHAIGHWGEWF